MTTFAEQRLKDNAAKFNTAEGASTITYAGDEIPVRIVYGKEHNRQSNIDAVGDEQIIIVRRTDISTTAPGTLVLIAGKSWKVKAATNEGSTPLNIALVLRSLSTAPIPRRSL